MAKQEAAQAIDDILDADEVRSVLRDTFFQSTEHVVHEVKTQEKPDHYKVICISMYTEDLERLDARVAALKRAGFRKMSRSAFIRFALDHVDESAMPRGY